MKPRIYSEPGHAPFQQAWTIDIEHLSYSDRKALKSGLDLDLYGMVHHPFYAWYNDRKLVLMDPTAEVQAVLEATCRRWERRHTIKAEPVVLPSLTFWLRCTIWLCPSHMAPCALKRLGNVYKRNNKFHFECELHGTKADLDFLRAMKAVVRSGSCHGASMRLRNKTLLIKAKRVEVVNRVHLCASRLTFDKTGNSHAITPLMLWLASISPAPN